MTLQSPAPHQPFQQALHQLATALGLAPDALRDTCSVESEGLRFYFQHDPDDELPSLSVLAEVDDVPPAAEPAMLRQLLEANSQLKPRSGCYALVPGTSRIALRMQVLLREDENNGERILNAMLDHIAACTAVRHVDPRNAGEAAR